MKNSAALILTDERRAVFYLNSFAFLLLPFKDDLSDGVFRSVREREVRVRRAHRVEE